MKRKVSGVQRVEEESKEGENNNIETKDKNDDTDVLFAPEGDESMPPPPSLDDAAAASSMAFTNSAKQWLAGVPAETSVSFL